MIVTGDIAEESAHLLPGELDQIREELKNYRTAAKEELEKSMRELETSSQ